MKRILSIFFAIIVIAMAFTCVYAEGSDAVIEDGIVVDDKATFDDFVKGLTNSTMWTTVGTVLLAVLGCVATIRKNFGFIADLIAKKADEKTINAALKSTSTEISEAFNLKLGEIEHRLSNTDSNEKILVTILTIFMTNANINPNAKAEIMQYLAGIKDINASVAEMVETANEIIAKADKAEIKEPTPALDSIMSETESSMVLS